MALSQSLKVQSHEFFFFHNKFGFSEYIHVHSVVLKVWFVKCSQITMFTLKISPQSHKNVHAMGSQSNKKTNTIGIQSNKKTHAMAFRATRKLMLRIQSNKKSNAKGNQSNKEIHAPVSGTNFFGNLGFEPNFLTKLEKSRIQVTLCPLVHV